MHNFLWFGTNFHPFVIYAFFGTAIAYGLVLGAMWLFRIEVAREKAWLYMLPLIIPFFTYVVGQVTKLNSKCVLVNGGSGVVGTLYQLLCVWSTKIANLLLPLFVVSMVAGLVKGLVSILACYRLTLKNNGSAQVRNRVMAYVKRIADVLQVAEPKLVILQGNSTHAFIFGFANPVLVLSESLIVELDDEELEALIAHELGHLTRGDNFGNWFSVFLRDMLFFAPFVHWAFQRLLMEREKAADDLAVGVTGKPLALGQALITTWKLSRRNVWQQLLLDNFSPNPGFFKLKGGLETRVRRMVEREVPCIARLDYRLIVFIVSLLTIPGLLFLC